MVRLSLVSLLAAAGFVASLPQTRGEYLGDLVEHERVPRIPQEWRLVRAVAPGHVLSLRVALKEHRKIDAKEILVRSDPSSSFYGKHFDAAGLREFLSASTSHNARDASWARVKRWITEREVNVVRESPDGFDIRIPASQAEALFGANFYMYSVDNDEHMIARAESYSLPSSLTGDIDYVYPTVHFFGRATSRPEENTLNRRQHSLPTGPFDCSKYYCPVNLTELYNIDYFPLETSASKLAIAGFLEEFPSHEDWTTFISQYGLSDPSIQAPYTVETVNGGSNPDTIESSGLEAMLDLEYTSAFTGPLNVTYYSVGGRPPTLQKPGNISLSASESANEPYLEFIDHLLEQENIPQVISISYTDDEQSVPYNYATKVCERFSLLALRGVSVLVASGDAGAQGTRFSDCEGPDGEPRFIPTFPASCPWVTTVGATAAWKGAAGFSSGGFSNYFERPSWQEAAAESYVASLSEAYPTPYYTFNTTGRGYPDVTLLGTDFLVVRGNFSQPAKGTSASTPVVASMIALLNDIRLKKGLPVLGFLNPLLYDNKVASSGFKDITEGSINGCATAEHQQGGYAAATGWDAASGLGEPDFAALRALLT
ncbi:Tripeptidyl-peptidase sed2 [Paramyrothecium foliicola]|nr:Tripeptidyl-peptidase sed2 [Paramyrothecium foliicola]